MSYRVLTINDETTQVAQRGPKEPQTFRRLIAFDLGDETDAVTVARMIHDQWKKRT